MSLRTTPSAPRNSAGKDLVRWKYQRYIKDYLRCVASVDDNIGRVLKYLDDTGLAQNTVVIYSSDQGWYLGDHGWYDKRWMYEESLTMPLVVRWPGAVKPGSVNEDLVSNVDFAETFLDMAGMADRIPEDMQGRSIVPVLRGETPDDWRATFYYHYYEFPGAHSVAKHYGVRTDRHKLIHFYRTGEWELFDLEKGPRGIAERLRRPGLQRRHDATQGRDQAIARGTRRAGPNQRRAGRSRLRGEVGTTQASNRNKEED